MTLNGLYKASRSALMSRVKSACGQDYNAEIQAAWGLEEHDYYLHQNEALGHLYAFAIANTPYYMARPELYPQFPGGLNTDRLRDLPVLTKSTVRAYNEEFWTRGRRTATVHTTSGTSGTPLRLRATVRERAFTQVLLEDWYRRLCGKRRPRTLALSGYATPGRGSKELYWKSLCGDQLFLSIYALSEANRHTILNTLQDFKPTLIYGYASAIHQLSQVVKSDMPTADRALTIISTSEVLHENWRNDIETCLKGRVYNLYGCQEGTHIALECDCHSLHVHPYVGIIEILDQDGIPCDDEGPGRVVVTSLRKKSMPLVRYDLGDIAVKSGTGEICPCGLQWPFLKRLEGRSEDLVRTADGRRIGMLSFSASRNAQGVLSSQIIQRGYDKFEVLIVLDPRRTVRKEDIEALLRAELTKRLGYVAMINFFYVDTIPRTKQGKLKAVVVEF